MLQPVHNPRHHMQCSLLVRAEFAPSIENRMLRLTAVPLQHFLDRPNTKAVVRFLLLCELAGQGIDLSCRAPLANRGGRLRRDAPGRFGRNLRGLLVTERLELVHLLLRAAVTIVSSRANPVVALTLRSSFHRSSRLSDCIRSMRECGHRWDQELCNRYFCCCAWSYSGDAVNRSVDVRVVIPDDRPLIIDRLCRLPP